MSHSMSVKVTGTTQLVMFPNGNLFGTTDAFAGSGRIERIEVSNHGTGTAHLNLSVWDACTPAGTPAAGGTGGVAQRFRFIGGVGGAAEKSPRHNPFWLGAPDAQVTACRRLVNQALIPPANAFRSFICELGIECPMGMIVTLDVANVANSNPEITVVYRPYVSGATRRRLFYRPDGTTLLERLTNAPV